MISLSMTLYTIDGEDGDRFKMIVICPDTGEPIDVTEQYEVVAVEIDGRSGFAVLKSLDDGTPHPTGAEL